LAAKLKRLIGKEFIAWTIIGIIAIGAVFVQSCPDHAIANELTASTSSTTWSAPSGWSALFSCPVHPSLISLYGDPAGS
jgi:hypothetical protein